MDSWSDFKPLSNPEQTKYDETKIDENAKKETLEVMTPSIENAVFGGDADEVLNQRLLDQGAKDIKAFSDKLNEIPVEKVYTLRDAFIGLKESIEVVGVALQERLGNALADSFSALGSALANGENAVLAFGKTFVTVMLDAVNSALQLLLVEMVTKSLIDGGGPIGTILAVGLGIAAISFLKSKMDSVKLAQGGLAFGPTLATVGDNRGASYDPEVIAPLSKLKSMLGDVGGGNPYVLTTRVAGSDLLVIMEKARNLNTRIR